MAEEEWFQSASAADMLRFLPSGASERKLRLFATAVNRLQSQMLAPEAIDVLGIAEQLADGEVDEEGRRTTKDRAYHLPWVADRRYAHWRGPAKACVIATLARKASEAAERAARGCAAVEAERKAAVLRDVFGNPFRPVAFDAAWRTATTTGLAAAMYEAREFTNMPILADALEEAGCDHPGVLAHCRDEFATHVRGCWVVDLVLGKN